MGVGVAEASVAADERARASWTRLLSDCSTATQQLLNGCSGAAHRLGSSGPLLSRSAGYALAVVCSA